MLGINSHWSTQAAELSARIWMRQMRFLYGYGKWDSDDTETACRQVYDLVTDSIRRLLVEVGLNEFDLTGKSSKASGIVDTITRMVIGSHENQGRKPLFNLDFASDYPIVAVGAPAASYYKDVADSMFIGLQSTVALTPVGSRAATSCWRRIGVCTGAGSSTPRSTPAS